MEHLKREGSNLPSCMAYIILNNNYKGSKVEFAGVFTHIVLFHPLTDIIVARQSILPLQGREGPLNEFTAELVLGDGCDVDDDGEFVGFALSEKLSVDA